MSNGFVKVPHDVARCSKLDPYTFRVYVVLAGHIGADGWDMTLRLLAEECAMSTKQVSRILPRLRGQFGLCYQARGNGGYHFYWTHSPVEETHSPVEETHSPVEETHSPVIVVSEETHSPHGGDSQSPRRRLTVPTAGTPLKEPKNQRTTTTSKRPASPELKEAIETWTAAGLGKVSMKATTELRGMIATHGLPLVLRGIKAAADQSVKWPVSWMQATLPAWKREETTNGTFPQRQGIPGFPGSAGRNGTGRGYDPGATLPPDPAAHRGF